MLWSRKFFVLILIMLTTSCVDFVSMDTNHLQQTAQVDPKKYKLHGRVYTMRGLFGVFSRGMDTLAKRADEELGVPSVSVPHSRNKDLSRFIITQRQQHHLDVPIVLVGHSLGADDEITVARSLNEAGVPIELLVTLDPVNPAKVPPNVKRVVNIYKPHALDKLPMLRGVPLIAENPQLTRIENINVNERENAINSAAVNHFNIDAHPDVQTRVMREIQNTLGPIPPQQLTWLQRLGRLFHLNAEEALAPDLAAMQVFIATAPKESGTRTVAIAE